MKKNIEFWLIYQYLIVCVLSAAQRGHLPPQHSPGPAGKAAGAFTNALRALSQAPPRLRQVQRELCGTGARTARGESPGNVSSEKQNSRINACSCVSTFVLSFLI